MNLNRRLSGITLSFAALMCASALTEEKEQYFRPCEEADISGVWRLENINETPPGRESTYFESLMPYQYVLFDTDGRYYYSESNMEFGTESSVSALAKSATSDQGLYYDARNKGKVVVKDSKAIKAQYSCNLVLKTAYPYIKGQLVLGQAVKDPPSTVMRMYRRLRTAAPSKKK